MSFSSIYIYTYRWIYLVKDYGERIGDILFVSIEKPYAYFGRRSSPSKLDEYPLREIPYTKTLALRRFEDNSLTNYDQIRGGGPNCFVSKASQSIPRSDLPPLVYITEPVVSKPELLLVCCIFRLTYRIDRILFHLLEDPLSKLFLNKFSFLLYWRVSENWKNRSWNSGHLRHCNEWLWKNLEQKNVVGVLILPTLTSGAPEKILWSGRFTSRFLRN